MSQGSQLVPFQMNSAADPVTPFCSTLQPDSALLQVYPIYLAIRWFSPSLERLKITISVV